MFHIFTKCYLISCDNYHYQGTSHNGHIVYVLRISKIVYFAVACLSQNGTVYYSVSQPPDCGPYSALASIIPCSR